MKVTIGMLLGVAAMGAPAMGLETPKVAYAPAGKGRIAYEDTGGSGPAVLCMPGMGDVRGEYRFLVPMLKEAGFRVLVADLRGHGDSTLGFERYRPEDSGDDVLAVLTHAGVARATLIGCSMSAGSIAWAAAQAPERIEALVMLGPAARDAGSSGFQATLNGMLYRALFTRPWGPSVWSWFYGTLYKQHRPSDLETYRAGLRTMLAQPGRMEALQAMIMASKKPVGDRLERVQAPTLLVMGSADPDFPDPRREAETLAGMLGGKTHVAVLEGLGHYPHVEDPQAVMELIRKVLPELTHGS